jgi:hypothetical protein
MTEPSVLTSPLSNTVGSPKNQVRIPDNQVRNSENLVRIADM